MSRNFASHPATKFLIQSAARIVAVKNIAEDIITSLYAPLKAKLQNIGVQAEKRYKKEKNLKKAI